MTQESMSLGGSQLEPVEPAEQIGTSRMPTNRIGDMSSKFQSLHNDSDEKELSVINGSSEDQDYQQSMALIINLSNRDSIKAPMSGSLMSLARIQACTMTHASSSLGG